MGEGLTPSLSCVCVWLLLPLSPCTVWQFSSCQGSEISFSLTCRVEQIEQNATNTFLVYTEEDLGDLLKIQLTWEGTSQSWYSLWKELRSYLSQPRNPRQELHIRRIRVKSGETQRKLTFCAEDPENTSISPGRELWFYKCRDGWRMKNETSPTVKLP